MTGGVASLFKANGVEWVNGHGQVHEPERRSPSRARRTSPSRARSSRPARIPIRPPIPGIDSPRCVDSTGLLAQTEVPRRLVDPRRRDHRLRVRLDLQPLRHRGDDHRDASDADPAGGRGRREGAREGVQEARDRAPPREAVHAGRRPRRASDGALRRGRDGRLRPDARLRRPRARSSTGSASRRRGHVRPRRGSATDDHRRTNVPHIYAAGDVAGYWQLAHTGFREGEVAAENAMGHDATIGDPAVPRPIYTDPEIAGVGLTEAQAREQYGDAVVVGRCPWVAIARAVMSGDTTGWVKTIHESDLRRASRRRHRRPARDRPDRGGRRRARRRVDHRDDRRRRRAASDPRRGAQGGRRSSRSAARSTFRRSVGRGRLAECEAAGTRSSGRSRWWFVRRWVRKRQAARTVAVVRRRRRRQRHGPRPGQRRSWARSPSSACSRSDSCSGGSSCGKPKGVETPPPSPPEPLRPAPAPVETAAETPPEPPRRDPARRRADRPRPIGARRPRPLRAGQAGRDRAARARPRARRQARLERGPVRAVPGGARGDRAGAAAKRTAIRTAAATGCAKRSPSGTASRSRRSSWPPAPTP